MGACQSKGNVPLGEESITLGLKCLSTTSQTHCPVHNKKNDQVIKEKKIVSMRRVETGDNGN